MFKKLEKSIIAVIDDKNNILVGKFSLREINYQGRKIKTLFINNERLSNRKNKVKYKCPTCGKEIILLLKRFLSKKSLYCRVCKEQNVDKRTKQSLFLKNSFKQHNKIISKNINKKDKEKDIIKESLKCWIKEDINFKDNYFKRILTNKEFSKIKNSILINNKESNNIIYHEHLLCNNQFKYSPYIEMENEYISFSEYSKNIKFKCESCSKSFNGRNFKTKVKSKKILCKDCLFSNKIFKIKYTTNIIGNKIRYQSKMEKSLIDFCNQKNILIENGPNVLYTFKNKEKTYRIDFKINKTLVETKDNHIWHRREVESGKWKLKSESAKKYCKNNNMKYKLLFPKDIENFKDSLIF